MRDPLRNLLAFGRWPAGVTGIPRDREWDAVVLLELPELEGSAIGELELSVPVAGEIAIRAEERVPMRAAERIAEELDTKVDRPYEVLVVRKDGKRWSAGARAILGDTISLPAGVPASTLEIVHAPGGEVEVTADGQVVDPALSPLFAEAVSQLEELARERFQTFVLRADRVGDGSWQLTIDPL